MKKDLVIFGAGGLGREILFQMQVNKKFLEEYNILGFVDDTPDLLYKYVNGLKVIGNSNWLAEYPTAINAVICLGNAKHRKIVAERLAKNKNINFPTLHNLDCRPLPCGEDVRFIYARKDSDKKKVYFCNRKRTPVFIIKDIIVLTLYLFQNDNNFPALFILV